MVGYFKRLIRNYFGFSGNQINGFLVLIPLMIVIVFSVPAYRYWISLSPPDFSADAAFLDSLVFVSNVSVEPGKEEAEITYFNFDPNEIAAEDFMRLGFPATISKRIVNYREKGGKFRVKSDLEKIYGLEPSLFEKIKPYILLPDKIETQKPVYEKYDKPKYTKKEIQAFDLNTADTAQLKQISGIGKVLSERIVKYRNQLGGFINENQLKEVYHLDSVTIARLLEHTFIEENFQPVGININLATEAELSKHPYISKSVAKAIVSYRFQHGKYTTLKDLEKIIVVTTEEREKIKPYLIFE